MADKVVINTEEQVKELVLCINGKDCVLKIDTQNVAVYSCLMNMCADVLAMQKKLESIKDDTNIEEWRKFANESVDLSDKCYEDFCAIFPAFQKATNGVCIRDFNIWLKIIFPISAILKEAKEKTTKEKVKNAIAEEMAEELE